MTAAHVSPETALMPTARSTREVGFDVPAEVGMSETDVETPCLVVDLDAFDHNLDVMRRHAAELGVDLRVHGKTHKSADVAREQVARGGAIGVCCQKVAEAQAFVRGGIGDVLISNQVTATSKIARLAALTKAARMSVCVDDADNVRALSDAVTAVGGQLDVLVEIDVGAGRCGVAPGDAAVALARAVDAAPGLTFKGLQAYNGSAQHIVDYAERRAAIEQVIGHVRTTLAALGAAGIACPTVTGAGTGSYPLEGRSGVYTELQCGSYVFMDRGYRAVDGETGANLPAFRHALFLLTTVMSHAKPDMAVCDAGLKSQSTDGGLAEVFGRDDVTYLKASDEHGVIADPTGVLAINDRLRLVPNHIDPTCNMHDWIVGIRNGRVEAMWSVAGRGKGY
ncbi:MAG: DSD1 family PLP-dependent enzyme [Pseudomonadota bacterium]